MNNFLEKQIDIPRAAEILRSGSIVGMPTETVYGLAAMADQPAAVLEVFSLKKRPSFDPLIVHVANEAQILRCSRDWNSLARALAAIFWPGPLTIVTPKAEIVSDVITAGLDTVGLRMPNHPLAMELISRSEIGIAAPSANPFGATSPTSPEHVRAYFPEVPVIDGGQCKVGIESTVVWPRIENEKSIIDILRPGIISAKEMATALAPQHIIPEFRENESVENRSPGQAMRHYAPTKKFIVIDVSSKEVDRQTVIDHLTKKYADIGRSWEELNLGSDPYGAARKLYRELIRLSSDATVDGIFVLRDHARHNQNWEAIWDRIERASDATFKMAAAV